MKWLGYVLALAVTTITAKAQCEKDWVSVDGLPGVAGRVNAAVKWDPDGTGPQSAGILIGGDFGIAGDARVSKLAFWNGSKWTPVANSFQGTVTKLCVRQGVPYAVVQSEGTPSQADLFRLDSAWIQVLRLNGPQFLYPSDVDELIVVGNVIYIAGTFGSVSTFLNGSATGQPVVDTKGVIRSTATGWEALPGVSAPAMTMTVAALPSGVAVYRDGQRFRVFDGSASYYLGGSATFWGEHELLFSWKNAIHILGPDPVPNTTSSKPTLYRWLGTNATYPDCFERQDVPFTGTDFQRIGLAVFADTFAVFGDTGGYRWRDGTATSFTYDSIGELWFCGGVDDRAIVAANSPSIGIGGYCFASWDPATLQWGVFGTGFNGPVNAMTTYRGDLCVAGSFTRAGSVAAPGNCNSAKRILGAAGIRDQGNGNRHAGTRRIALCIRQSSFCRRHSKHGPLCAVGWNKVAANPTDYG
jgi:hypothetical protein